MYSPWLASWRRWVTHPGTKSAVVDCVVMSDVLYTEGVFLTSRHINRWINKITNKNKQTYVKTLQEFRACCRGLWIYHCAKREQNSHNVVTIGHWHVNLHCLAQVSVKCRGQFSHLWKVANAGVNEICGRPPNGMWKIYVKDTVIFRKITNL